ncbi:hypothetical protein WH47_00747 [Habropoda laboriosa]|uniref:Uncharacterized protein n=1 Tax=Habropoda laboriosa TaxID=597456 RepID=A0A0L7QYJ9_9HYME|nr:hypothetical protein WH47_00747 [Habropoda laboriosa]
MVTTSRNRGTSLLEWRAKEASIDIDFPPQEGRKNQQRKKEREKGESRWQRGTSSGGRNRGAGNCAEENYGRGNNKVKDVNADESDGGGGGRRPDVEKVKERKSRKDEVAHPGYSISIGFLESFIPRIRNKSWAAMRPAEPDRFRPLPVCQRRVLKVYDGRAGDESDGGGGGRRPDVEKVKERKSRKDEVAHPGYSISIGFLESFIPRIRNKSWAAMRPAEPDRFRPLPVCQRRVLKVYDGRAGGGKFFFLPSFTTSR